MNNNAKTTGGIDSSSSSSSNNNNNNNNSWKELATSVAMKAQEQQRERMGRTGGTGMISVGRGAGSVGAGVATTITAATGMMMMDRLQSNDPSLTRLELYGFSHQMDIGQLMEGLSKNDTITSIEISWRFLRGLTETKRICLLEQIGSSIVNLQELALEAVSPCQALIQFLGAKQQQQKQIQDGKRKKNGSSSVFRSLRVGSLRVDKPKDVEELGTVLAQNTTLEFISFSNIQAKVQGTYQVDDNGEVWFVEQQEQEQEQEQQVAGNVGGGVRIMAEEAVPATVSAAMAAITSLDPLLEAMAKIPTLKRVQLQNTQMIDSFAVNVHRHDDQQPTAEYGVGRILRIRERSFERLCESKSLKSMVFHSCRINDDHCKTIRDCLKKTTTPCGLESISITGKNNRIGRKGYEALCLGLRNNYTMKELYIETNEEEEEEESYHWKEEEEVKRYRTMMDLYLHLNWKGRGKLLLTNHNDNKHPNDNDYSATATQADWIELLIEEHENLNAIFYLITTNPLLCM